MNKKIIINSLEQIGTNNGCNAIFKITIDNNEHSLTYKIMGKGITAIPQLCDGVVVSLLPFATRFGMDIQSEIPISKSLYYNIVKHLLPQLYVCDPAATHKIELNIPISEERYSGKWRGTGVSLGVDSFATIHEYTDDCPFDEYRLTHLVHLKTGAHHSGMTRENYNPETEDKLFCAEHDNVVKYCRQNNFDLVTIESNFHSIAISEFESDFSPTHTFRNLGTVLLIQNYFDKYYYASAYNLDHFKISLKADSSHYEKWLLHLISNDSISFYSSNESMSRAEKIKYISQFADTYDNLHVCWTNEKNCGRCAKCVRTLTQLDMLNVLDKYKNSFDIDYYRANVKKYRKLIVARRKRDLSFNEIYEQMKRQGIKMPGPISVIPTKIHLARGYIKRNIKPLLRFIKKR